MKGKDNHLNKINFHAWINHEQHLLRNNLLRPHQQFYYP